MTSLSIDCEWRLNGTPLHWTMFLMTCSPWLKWPVHRRVGWCWCWWYWWSWTWMDVTGPWCQCQPEHLSLCHNIKNYRVRDEPQNYYFVIEYFSMKILTSFFSFVVVRIHNNNHVHQYYFLRITFYIPLTVLFLTYFNHQIRNW